jgi:colicin import membrane protein
MRLWTLLLVCLAMAGALAAVPPDAERARIADERRAVLATFESQELACQARFAVTACLDELRARRRQALAPLRERELQIDAIERKQRGLERQAAVAAKQRAVVARLQAAEAAPAASGPAREPPAAGMAGSTPSVGHRGEGAEARATKAAVNVQSARKRQAEVQAGQARVARRQAERNARGKDDAHLALPGPSASATGR